MFIKFDAGRCTREDGRHKEAMENIQKWRILSTVTLQEIDACARISFCSIC